MFIIFRELIVWFNEQIILGQIVEVIICDGYEQTQEKHGSKNILKNSMATWNDICFKTGIQKCHCTHGVKNEKKLKRMVADVSSKERSSENKHYPKIQKRKDPKNRELQNLPFITVSSNFS